MKKGYKQRKKPTKYEVQQGLMSTTTTLNKLKKEFDKQAQELKLWRMAGEKVSGLGEILEDAAQDAQKGVFSNARDLAERIAEETFGAQVTPDNRESFVVDVMKLIAPELIKAHATELAVAAELRYQMSYLAEFVPRDGLDDHARKILDGFNPSK